ncbi:MAG: HXXEE domain-containing protein [Clostridium sp.]
MFPIIFIVHDMEEIIGLKSWLKRNRVLIDEKYPFVNKLYKDFSTEGFAVAVFEELIACIFICILAMVMDNECVWLLWLGGFIGCTLHFVVHIVQSIIMRKYIPAVITSVILLPISVWIIIKAMEFIASSMITSVLWIAIGVVIVGVNLRFAQSLIGRFTRWQDR